MCTLLLVPVLVCVLPHIGRWRIHRRLIGNLPPTGRIQHCTIFDATVADVWVVAAPAAVVAAVIVTIATVVVFPHSWGWRRVAGHRVAGVWTVFKRNITERKLSVLVELLKLGATVLEPDFDLRGRR